MRDESDEASSPADGQASTATMNREHRWPVQWTNRLQRLTTMLSGLAGTSAMARATVEQGRAALDAEAGVVFLLTADGSALQIAHATGYKEDTVQPWLRVEMSFPIPATDAVRNHEAVLVRSREELKQRYPELAATPGALERSSWAAVPLIAGDVCIGAIGLSFLAPRIFDTQEVDFLRVVADHCAQALQRTLLSASERRSTERLRALAQASRVFAAANPDVGSVLQAVVAEVLAHLGPSCWIALASPDGEWLDAAAVRDRDRQREQILQATARTLRVRRGEGLAGKVLATGQAVLLPSLSPRALGPHTVPVLAEQMDALDMRSLLIVPLKTSGRILGTIATSRYDTATPFTDEDRTLLEDLADRAALALENARLHEAERRARARAEEADRRKDEFLAMLGHELRNPLAPIGAAIEILRQLPMQGQGERALWAREALGRQVAQLTRLVDDLLDVSRINLGKIELRLEPLDLGTVALQALEASRPLLSEHGHQVSIDLPPHPARVNADAVRLTQVISNLLNNAAKYTEPGGRVRLSVASEGANAMVMVADTGIGIAPDMLGQVFDLFAQGPGARDRSKGGLGIGLTLVKRLIELHGGSVTASSAGEGRGSEFVLRLPLIAADVAPLEARRAQGGTLPGPRRRILIADDNADAAEGLRQLLELDGHEVRVVHDGSEALDVVSRFAPEVILLDIGLPEVDGLEVARRVRSDSGAHRPLLVAVTGLGRADDRRRSAEAGFDHHLVKPIDLSSLEGLLAETIGAGMPNDG